jgi:hypothetical protein
VRTAQRSPRSPARTSVCVAAAAGVVVGEGLLALLRRRRLGSVGRRLGSVQGGRQLGQGGQLCVDLLQLLLLQLLKLLLPSVTVSVGGRFVSLFVSLTIRGAGSRRLLQVLQVLELLLLILLLLLLQEAGVGVVAAGVVPTPSAAEPCAVEGVVAPLAGSLAAAMMAILIIPWYNMALSESMHQEFHDSFLGSLVSWVGKRSSRCEAKENAESCRFVWSRARSCRRQKPDLRKRRSVRRAWRVSHSRCSTNSSSTCVEMPPRHSHKRLIKRWAAGLPL